MTDWRNYERPRLRVRTHDCEGIIITCVAENEYGLITREYRIEVVGKD